MREKLHSRDGLVASLAPNLSFIEYESDLHDDFVLGYFLVLDLNFLLLDPSAAHAVDCLRRARYSLRDRIFKTLVRA